jgi:predicted dehydrogenase
MPAGKNPGWGILGTGTMAREFADALHGVNDNRLVAVASRSQPTADAFGREFGALHCYGNYSEMMDDSAVDIVYIATPHSSHSALSIDCLRAGKAVLCEKPFAINAAQAETVISLAREKKLFLMEAMWTRFVPAINKLRDLLERQAIGDVQLMVAGGAYMPGFDPDHYLFDKALGGGILLDAGVYLVSIASMLFGVPDRILATGALGRTGVDEHDAILLRHRGGELANLYVSHRARSAPDLTLLGSGGRIYLHPPVFCPSALTLSVNGREDEVFDFEEASSGYRYEILEANRCLRSGRQESELMPLDETLAIMRTMDEIRRQIGIRYSADGSTQ